MKVDRVYRENHFRLFKARGRADQFPCIDCSGPARTWSQIKGCDGTDPSHFEPRCSSCHTKYDFTEDTREKLRKALNGNKNAAGHRNQNSLGYKHTEESRRKMSIAKMGNQNARKR